MSHQDNLKEIEKMKGSTYKLGLNVGYLKALHIELSRKKIQLARLKRYTCATHGSLMALLSGDIEEIEETIKEHDK